MQPYLIMLAAGIGVPLLAALNSALGRHLGSPITAAIPLFLVALCCAIAVAGAQGLTGLAKIASAPKHLFFAGCFVAFYMLSVTWAAPRIGVGNAIFFALLGQLICATAIGHFGWFGAEIARATAPRLLGLALMGAGIFLTLKG